MRIGSQLYGFQGIDITRAPTAAFVATRNSSAATTTNNADVSKNLATLKGLVSDLRNLVAKPVTTDSQQATYAAQDAELRRDVEYLTISEPTSYNISRTTISGANATQLGNLQLHKYDAAGPVTIVGEVTTAAAAAELTISGDQNGQATEAASYNLTTERGVFQIQFSGGESLQDVASRIFASQTETGVIATVSGDDLVLTSATIGSPAQILLERTDTSPTIVSGLNAAQVTSVNALQQTAGTSDTLTGSVVSQAAAAELIYQGAADQTIAGSSAFRLTGSAGSVLVSVTQGESLAAVANRLNQQTSSTGVVVTQDDDTLRFTSVEQGSTESVRIDQVVQAETLSTTGRNDAQVVNFSIDSIERGAEETISGQVLTTAGKASLTIQGSGTGTVISSGTFELRGNTGTTNISITKDESLSDVVTRINNLTGTTGVTGRIQSNQIVLESTGVGSAAEVEVNLLSLPYTVETSGRNAAQLSSFDVQTFNDGATQTFSGNVTQAADVAEFYFRGSAAGFVNKTATFTLTGSQGSHQFSTTTTQTLSNLASQINAETATTGVTATVSGRNLFFRSTNVGSAAEINLQINSGSFNINGGDANGSAFGQDAKATINGVVHTGLGNDFSFTDGSGSYTFSTVQGYTGSLSTITVTSTAGTFDLSGGDGNGNAQGTDATAEINGVQLIGTGNNFSVTTANGQFSLGFAPEFTGTFDPITAKSTLDVFSFTGGDQTGTATGTDFIANVNGTEYRGLNNTLTHTTANGSYELTFDSSYIGQFDPITISTSAGPQITGGDGAGHSTGIDAEGDFNGQHFIAVGATFQYSDAEVELSFEIATGFVGQIDPLTIDTTTEVVHDVTTRVVEQPRNTGKNFSQIGTAPQPTSNETKELSSILQQIEELASLGKPAASESNSDTNPDVTNPASEKLSNAPVGGLIYQRIVQNAQLNTNPAIQQLLNANLSFFKSSVDFKG